MQSNPFLERPRERCLRSGSHCLSLRELIALLLGSGPPGEGCLGLASRILDRPGKWKDPMDEEKFFFSFLESPGHPFLNDIEGLGPAMRAKILAAFEIGKRYHEFKIRSQLPPYFNPSAIEYSIPHLAKRALAKISQKKRGETHEWIGFVPVHQDGSVGSFCEIEKGSRTQVNLDPGDLFSRILLLRPKGYFLFHNHPSGAIVPSHQDLDLTKKVGKLSEDLGVHLLGHWIVTARCENLIEV